MSTKKSPNYKSRIRTFFNIDAFASKFYPSERIHSATDLNHPFVPVRVRSCVVKHGGKTLIYTQN